MATRRQPFAARPSLRHGANYRHTRSSLYVAHTPTLEPTVDEESEGDVDSTLAPTTPSTESGPDPEREEDQSPSYEVYPSPGSGGLGIYANRAIAKGAVIFSEPPLFTQPLLPARTNSSVMITLSNRTRDEQRQFFALWNAYKVTRPGHPALLPALGIFETNALPCTGFALECTEEDSPTGEKATVGRSGAREGIFLQASRFNHSCEPNVSRAWDAERQQMTFRALRDIAADEELCLNYVGIGILGTREQRRASIEEAFGFLCICQVCGRQGKEGEDSDRRRGACKRLYEEIGTCGKEPTLGLRKVKLAMRFLEEEKLMHYEATFCFDAFQFCVSVSDFANAKLWARRAWEVSCSISGPDSPSSRTFKMFWANPRAHQLSGTLPRMTLQGPDQS